MTSILALDLGTTTGWAVSKLGVIKSGVISFKPTRFHGGGMRYLRFRREFLDTHSSIDEVYFEAVRAHAGVDAAHAYGGFLATLTAWCEERNIPYLGFSVKTIKKHATGSGSASKLAMINSARARGHSPVDDNEADALAVLYCALDHIRE